jgi:hypothetical protein
VRQLVSEGKRVFVPCTSASHCRKLETLLNDEFPEAAILCITGKDSGDKKRELARDIHTEMSKYQVVIISPAMTAGPSFELPHFTHVVAFGKNSPANKGPTVDSFLQQLFRVRDLGLDGVIDIYIIDSPKLAMQAGALTEAELDVELLVCAL